MKNCGRRFHNEVAKYRFLNELIKVVSPKVRTLTTSTASPRPSHTVLDYFFPPSTYSNFKDGLCEFAERVRSDVCVVHQEKHKMSGL